MFKKILDTILFLLLIVFGIVGVLFFIVFVIALAVPFLIVYAIILFIDWVFKSIFETIDFLKNEKILLRRKK